MDVYEKQALATEIVKYAFLLILSLLTTWWFLEAAYNAPDRHEARRRQIEQVKNDEMRLYRAIGGR